MDATEAIKRAMESRKPIQFEYNKTGKKLGKRIGNPHAIFILTSKANVQSIKAHIVQTAGVYDSAKPFPSFRMFDVKDLTNIKILTECENFQVHQDYNPAWNGYMNSIAKI